LNRAFLIASSVSALAFGLAVSAHAQTQSDQFNWTGFYAGVNLGGAWNTNCSSFLATSPTGTVTYSGSHCPGASFIGGGQLGYNYQIGSWVLGLEGDVSGATSKSDNFARTVGAGAAVPAGTYSFSGNHTPSAIGTIRARIGYSFGGNRWLVYGTGGGIFAGSSANVAIGYVSTDGTQAANFSRSSSTTRTGWTLGGGIEYKLSERWSLKAEDLYANTGNLSVPNNCVDTANGAVCSNFSHVVFSSANAAGNVNIFRVGVNYKFF
jgi:outer membrane immunogenic protein